MVAQRIGAYEVLFELGHGGMGTVYLARALGESVGASGFERLVAIKRLHLHLLTQTESVQRFLEEARLAARIHHANVVGIHQVGSDEAGHFLVQDYVEGDNLEGLIDRSLLRRRPLPPPIVLRIALDALAGLAAVHEARGSDGQPLDILHRDVAPQNLLVGRDGVTRLSDFGIAKHAESSVVTDRQYLQGRVLYMPPEYLRRGPVDARFDVYGMGMTLFTALAGSPPWTDASDAQIVHSATTEGVPSLSSCGLSIAPAIEALVARACHKEASERFPTARAMLEAIEELGRHTGWVASHNEVAELVESLAGRDLASRRSTTASAERTDPGLTDRTPGAIVLVQAPPSPVKRGRTAMLLAAAALAGGCLVGLGSWLRAAPIPADAVALAGPGREKPAGAAASTAKPVLPAETSPAVEPPAAPSALPSATASASPAGSAGRLNKSKGAPSAAASAALPPPSAAPLPPPVAAAPPPKAPEPPPAPVAPALGAPTISSANPYH